MDNPIVQEIYTRLDQLGIPYRWPAIPWPIPWRT